MSRTTTYGPVYFGFVCHAFKMVGNGFSSCAARPRFTLPADCKTLWTSAVVIFAINEIPSSVGSLPDAAICLAATSTYACFKTSLKSGNATAFLTANRTKGRRKYLKAASKWLLTDCGTVDIIPTKCCSNPHFW